MSALHVNAPMANGGGSIGMECVARLGGARTRSILPKEERVVRDRVWRLSQKVGFFALGACTKLAVRKKKISKRRGSAFLNSQNEDSRPVS